MMSYRARVTPYLSLIHIYVASLDALLSSISQERINRELAQEYAAQIRMTTLIDYTSKVKNYIIKPLGDMHMGDVTADDIRLALLAAVSYTHLDVYKRQVMIGGHESFLFNEDEKWFVEAKEQCL